MTFQAAILSGVPPHASFLFLGLRDPGVLAEGMRELASVPAADHLILGVGSELLSALGTAIPGLRPMPVLPGSAIDIPSTPSDLFIRVAGSDPGGVYHREREILSLLPSFVARDRVAGFVFGNSRDLTGYEDGTENPTGADAERVAFRADGGPGIAGSSVVAVQRWIHDMSAFDNMNSTEQNHAIGRDRESNDELEHAPESAHVKRTAQEDFEPEAFTLRRSMPWRDPRGAGLVFVSFSATLDPFEAQLRRMVGLDDGTVDGLFQFTRPVDGGTWWCPPVREGYLDLRAIIDAEA